MKSRKGFTLVELLLVIAIIALLISIFVPMLRTALERARQVKCKSNLRNIGTAMIAFADDHDGRLPGCYANASGGKNDPEWTKEFIGKEVLIPEASWTLWMKEKDHVGTLLEYLPVSEADARRIYRCPSLPKRTLGSGEGSNGMFDYTMVKTLAGGMLSRIPSRAILFRNDPDREREVATPLMVEESPERVNGVNIDPGFANVDRFGSWHGNGKGFYCGVDGGVVEVKSTSRLTAPRCYDFEVRFANEWHRIHYIGTDFGELPW